MNRKDNRTKKLVIKNRRRKAVRTLLGICFVSMIAFTMFFAGFKISAVAAGAKGLDTGNSEK